MVSAVCALLVIITNLAAEQAGSLGFPVAVVTHRSSPMPNFLSSLCVLIVLRVALQLQFKK